jgi:nucleotide-binding universal stress UspA family protein
MQNVWALASLWVGPALVATLLAIWFKISTALTEIVVGTVAQIVHRAETDHIDVIVLGRRGMSRFEKMIVGSTSAKVLRYAHCPVMVVR